MIGRWLVTNQSIKNKVSNIFVTRKSSFAEQPSNDATAWKVSSVIAFN